MNIIEVSNLTKRYGNLTAVDRVSFAVEKGTMVGYLGINGAGKTTVVSMLTTLLTPDSGTVVICGEELGKRDDHIRRKTGVVYQQNCLDDILTVRENLICRGILHGISRAEAKQQCVKLSDILKLGDMLKRKYRTLSGGQKRRCEIAAALMHTPEILFLDEPTTGLDPATRLDVWNMIEELQRKENMTVFLTTHYMEEAARADQIIIMGHGRIITSGTPFELKEKYASDRLKLYCNGEERKTALVRERIAARFHLACEDGESSDQGVIEIQIPSTMDALAIIHSVEDVIEGFEVIQGNMDNVFLKLVSLPRPITTLIGQGRT